MREKELVDSERLKELKTVMGDPYSSGAFCGMITNILSEQALTANPELQQPYMDAAVALALDVRIALKKRAGTWVDPK